MEFVDLPAATLLPQSPRRNRSSELKPVCPSTLDAARSKSYVPFNCVSSETVQAGDRNDAVMVDFRGYVGERSSDFSRAARVHFRPIVNARESELWPYWPVRAIFGGATVNRK